MSKERGCMERLQSGSSVAVLTEETEVGSFGEWVCFPPFSPLAGQSREASNFCFQLRFYFLWLLLKTKRFCEGKEAFKRTWVWLMLLPLSCWWHSLLDCTLKMLFLGVTGEPGCLLQYKRISLHNHSNKHKVKFKDFRDLPGFITMSCRI